MGGRLRRGRIEGLVEVGVDIAFGGFGEASFDKIEEEEEEEEEEEAS